MAGVSIFTVSEKKTLLALVISSMLPLLDGSIVNVILPVLGGVFNVNSSNIQWVVTSYFLASIIGLLISSSFQGGFGAKTVWMTSGSLFCVGSVAAGLSDSFPAIIFSRVIQGIGAGMLMPLSQAIIAEQFGKDRMRDAMGMVAIPAVFAPALGPLVGALFSEYVTWRLLFFINLPLGAISLYIGNKYLKKGQVIGGGFSFITFIMMSVSLGGLFYSLAKVKEGVNDELLILIIISVIMTVGSLIVNSFSARKIINLSGFKNFSFTLSIIMGILVSFLFYSFMLFYPLASASYGGNSTMFIGVMLGLQGVGAWIGRRYLNKLTQSWSPFMVISLGVFISTISLSMYGYNEISEGCAFVIRGIGLGIATIACLSAPMQWTEKESIKDTSVITRFSQQAGAVLGGIFAGGVIYFLRDSRLSIHDCYVLFFALSLTIMLLMIATSCIGVVTHNDDHSDTR